MERWFGNNPLYQALIGGRRYYKCQQGVAWKKKDFLYIGDRVCIDDGVSIIAPEKLHIGSDTGIYRGCVVQAVGGCHIGRGCQIAFGTIILTTEHVHSGAEALPHGLWRYVKPVIIEDFVWIASGVHVSPGVRIGEGAIIGMGSVVMQDVPPQAIVMGNPAKVMMYRSEEEFHRLKEAGRIIDPFAQSPLLRIPPVTIRKYGKELKRFGYDVSDGNREFYYDKSAPLSQRSRPFRPEDYTAM
jgi:acetyltransferase-like isoleucine patch superfamily enzyme